MVDNVNEKTRVPQDAPKEVKPAEVEGGKPEAGEYKIAELRDDFAIVEAEDGRMFPAQLKTGLNIRKGTKVELQFDDLDKDGIPKDATVVATK